MNKEKIGKAALYGTTAALTVFTAVGLDHRLAVRHYEVKSGLVKNPVRLALVTDLHSCRYGKNQHVLVDAIKNEKPDLLMLSGDIFDNERTTKYTEIFFKEINNLFPTYMVLGNHECKCGEDDNKMKMDIVSQYSIRVLSNEVECLEINGTRINICGADDMTRYTFDDGGDEEQFFEQLKNIRNLADNGYYTVLLSHNPAYIEQYAENGFDLVLCGHAHGGQWIIPHVLNGVLAPGQGLFPKYAGGEYVKNGTRMIVSRGLARESTPVPRFYNRPELVMIDLKPED